MKRRILSVFLVFCMMLSMVPVTFAVETHNEPEQLLQTASEAHVAYAVNGGNIYYDPNTGAIVDCDESVIEANIPNKIGGVSIVSIGGYAFNKCINLKSINLPESLISIGGSAFDYCSSLTSISIPNGVTSIDSYAFANCSGLRSINLPGSVTSIGESAFANCISLTSISIPDKVTNIGSSMFFHCSSLKSIDLPDNLTYLGGNHTFDGCSSLTNISIPDGATIIGAFVFTNCSSLESVRIPDSVTIIVNYAFDGCINLSNVYFGGDKSQWDSILIGDGNDELKSATIHYGEFDLSLFDPALYRAKFLQRKDEAQVVNAQIERETPSEQITTALRDTAFDEIIMGMKIVDLISKSVDDITALYDFSVEPKEIYSGLLLNMLEASVSIDLLDDDLEQLMKKSKTFVDEMKSYMDLNMQLDNLDFSRMEKEDYDKFMRKSKEVLATFDPKYSTIETLSEVFKGVKLAFDIEKSIEEFYERIIECKLIANTSEQMKDVLRQAYEDSKKLGDPYLQLALSDCIELIDSSGHELIGKIAIGELSVAGEKTGKYLAKEVLWGNVKTALKARWPGVSIIQEAYKTGKIISNLAFKTDDMTEAYLKMLSVEKIEELFDTTYSNLKDSFNTKPSTKTADVYLTSLDVVFNLRDLDTITAYGLVTVLDDAMLTKVLNFFNKTDRFSELKENLRNIQKNYTLSHENVLTQWIEYLNEDYPGSGLYEYYSVLFDESIQRILSKEFLAACPVDVYVYDQNDQLIASVINGDAQSNGEVMVALLGDTKVVRLFGDDAYRIEYVGTDYGSMDVTITEFNKDGTSVRTVNYYDVALERDQAYSVDTGNAILSGIPYELTQKGSGQTVICDYDSLLTKTEAHTITVQSGSLIQNGEIFLSTTAKAGEALEVNAYVPENYCFVRWEASNGDDIFQDERALSTKLIMPDEAVVVRAIIRSNSKNMVAVEAVSIDQENIKFTELGDTITLSAAISPENAADQSLMWISDNEKIATVDREGTVTAISNGTAMISVSALDGGHTATCMVLVDSDSESTDIPVTNTISIAGTQNGMVELSTKEAEKGSVITVTVIPDKGYEMEMVKAVDEIGNELALTSKSEKTYTFIMPEGTVTVTAVFKKTQEENHPPAVDSNGGGSSGGVSNIGGGSISTPSSVTLPTTSNGSVIISPQTPKKDDTVTIIVKPDNGYTLKDLTVKDGSGKEITLTKVNDTTYTFTMPAGKVSVNSSFAKAEEGPSEAGFTDVPKDAYYADAVAWAVSNDITSGTSATTFSPDNPCTRAQIVTFLWRAAGSPAAGNSNPFTDVASGSYYYDAVQWAVAQGITTGTSSTTFSPDTPCTRGQAVTFLHRANNAPKGKEDNTFVDVASNAYYADAVQWAVSNGITNGTGPNKFSPDNSCTRAQIVTFLYRDRAN